MSSIARRVGAPARRQRRRPGARAGLQLAGVLRGRARRGARLHRDRECVFVKDGTRGGELAVLTLALVIFAVHVPLLIGFTVARHQA